MAKQTDFDAINNTFANMDMESSATRVIPPMPRKPEAAGREPDSKNRVRISLEIDADGAEYLARLRTFTGRTLRDIVNGLIIKDMEEKQDALNAAWEASNAVRESLNKLPR